ncbi:reverse transcriptase domain-containing protein [Tanacetum coccineum]
MHTERGDGFAKGVEVARTSSVCDVCYNVYGLNRSLGDSVVKERYVFLGFLLLINEGACFECELSEFRDYRGSINMKKRLKEKRNAVRVIIAIYTIGMRAKTHNAVVPPNLVFGLVGRCKMAACVDSYDYALCLYTQREVQQRLESVVCAPTKYGFRKRSTGSAKLQQQRSVITWSIPIAIGNTSISLCNGMAEIWVTKSLLVKVKKNVLGLEIVRDESVGSHVYHEVCTRPDIASAGVGMLDGFDHGLQTHVQVFMDFDYTMGRSIIIIGRSITSRVYDTYGGCKGEGNLTEMTLDRSNAKLWPNTANSWTRPDKGHAPDISKTHARIKLRGRENRNYSGIKGHQRPEQNLENKARETGIPEAHHRTPVYSKDSRRTDPLHRSPGCGKKGACLIGWEERSQLHPRVLIVVGEVPKQKEPKLKQEGVNKGKHLLVRLANTRKVRTVKEVIGNPSQEGRNLTPMKMISISLGHLRKEILSHHGSGTLVSRGLDASNVKTYDEAGDPGRSPNLLKESIDSYEDLRAFRENYLQQTKHIKDPVEIHHIKQRDGESTKDFMDKIYGRSPGRIPRSVDEMYRMTMSFLQGEVAALSHGRRKESSSWKPSEGGDKPTFKKGFKNKQIPDRKPDKFSLLTKTPKEIFALEKGKFKAPPPMNDKPKAPKKGEASGKDKPLTILMIQPWERVAKPRITQSFSPKTAMSFPPLSEKDGTETPMIIEVEMGGHFVHRVYIDGGASSEVTIPNTNAIIGRPGLRKSALYHQQGTRNIENIPLRRHINVTGVVDFRLEPDDLTGESHNIAEHRLNNPGGISPVVRQKKRGQAPERNKAIQEEVEKLVDAGIMKEVHYHSWLSNPVMVKKHDGTWRMCVDFKDLNNACPKDCYPLPEIDWKVESLCGYSFKCFLDAYKGYHQIKMAKEDEEKTAFITSQGIFCYSKMPFGLKNAGSTYQRLVDKAFQRQIGRNLEVYVDDLVIKSRTEEEIIRDITETFKTLRQINMKLNPKKCAFGMQEGMFLGYKVSTNGLRACPDKADAVLSLSSPRCIKDVQKLNGKLASLNRFLSKSAEKSLPFFKNPLKIAQKRAIFMDTEARGLQKMINLLQNSNTYRS